jgi:hypothetical protein
MLGLAVAASLGACGGGGGGSSPPPAPPVSWAATGHYSPVLKTQGSTNSLVFALSLVHPDHPDTEYVMDTVASPTKLGAGLEQGTYNASTKRFTGLAPVAYLDAPNDIPRLVSLAANNSKRPGETKGIYTNTEGVFCSGPINSYNFVNALYSQVAATKAGADGVCGTADDLGGLLGYYDSVNVSVPTLTAFQSLGSGVKLLGYTTSYTTGQPTAWLLAYNSGQLSLNRIGVALSYSLTGNFSDLAAAFPVASLGDTVLFSLDGALWSLHVDDAFSVRTVTKLSALTGPDGWQLAGVDTDNIYVFLNSSTTFSGTGTWAILSIVRSTQAVTTLATGLGSIVTAGAVPQRLYVSVLNGSAASMLRVASATGATSTYIAPSTTSVPIISTSASGAHLIMTASTITGVLPSVQLIDDDGVQLYSLTNGTLYGTDATQFDINTASRVPDGYFFLTPISASTGFGGSTIVRYDIATKSTRTMGVIPTGAALGGLSTDSVFAGPIIPYAGFGGIGAARKVGGQFQSTGSAVYTYSVANPNSLLKTTVRVQ